MYLNLDQASVKTFLEHAFRIVFVGEFLPVLWSSCSQECDDFAGIAFLYVAAFRAIRLNGIGQKFCEKKATKEIYH